MDNSFNVPWTGYYMQGGVENEMSFDHLFINALGQISGRGGDPVGNFSIYGQINPNGSFGFTKTYEGAHSVDYRGSVSPGCLSGQWSIGGMSTILL